MGIRLGLCQMRVTPDKQENLRRAESCLRQAAAQGANLALLPEMFNCPYENACFPVYGEPAGGETWQFLSGMARELGIYLAGGSVPEIEGEAIYNTCYLFSPQGSRTTSPPAARSRWWTQRWENWGWPSALISALPSFSGSWGTWGPS